MEDKLIAAEKRESTLVFKKAEAFYEYLENLLSAEGYVLVETCPRLHEETGRKEKADERREDLYTRNEWA